MIPTVKWIKKGFAKQNPQMANNLYAAEENEMKMEKDDNEDFKNYEDEESNLMRDLPIFVSESNLKNNKYADEYPVQVEDSEDDEENYVIKSTDCILMAAKIEEESSLTEVYVYEEEKYNLYVHHEVMLNSFPIALEWLCCDFSKMEGDSFLKANFAVVGLMNSAIEIWDLDLLESVEPFYTFDPKSGHKDSITNITLHPSRMNLLASAGADKSLKFWDLQSNKCISTFSKFSEVPQNLMWDLSNESIVHAYSTDNVWKRIDARVLKETDKMKFNFVIENFSISPSNPNILFLSCEDGHIRTFDMTAKKLIEELTVKAHKEAITSIICNNSGHLISNSLDGNVSVWRADNLQKLATQETDCKKLFGSSIHRDNDYLFACGSEIGEVVIWDFSLNVKQNE